MTILQSILEDKQEDLRQHLICEIDVWRCILSQSPLNFHSAEQMMHFFMTDVMTTLFYQFRSCKEVQGRLLNHIEKDISMMRVAFHESQKEAHNKKE